MLWLSVCFCLLYELYLCYASSFIVGNVTLPRDSMELAIGYDNATNTILLFGGRYSMQQFVKFKNHQFIDGGKDYLPYATYSTGQNYAQINNRLWMINDGGQYIFAVDTQTYAADESTVSLPTTIEQRACLASNKYYLFVVGGADSSTKNDASVDLVQIYDTQNNEWLPNQANLPKMNRIRRSLSCITVGSDLFAIGGYTGADDLDSIEMLDISNIGIVHSQQWTYFDDSLTQPLSNTRAVSYGNDILVIGGYKSGDIEVSDVHIIYTEAQTCEIWSVLETPLECAASIILHNTLFVIGGKTIGLYSDCCPNTYRYMILPTIAPSTYASPTAKPVTMTPSYDPTAHPSNISISLSSPTSVDIQTNDPTLYPIHQSTVFEEPFNVTTYAPIHDSHEAINDSLRISSSSIHETLQSPTNATNDNNEVVDFHPLITTYTIVITTVICCMFCIIYMCIYFARKTFTKNNDMVEIQSMSHTVHNAPDASNIMMNELVKQIQLRHETHDDNEDKDKRALREWFTDSVMLPQYFELFLQNGYKNIEFIKCIESKEELKQSGIHREDHQDQIWREIQKLNGRKMEDEDNERNTAGTKHTIERGEGELVNSVSYILDDDEFEVIGDDQHTTKGITHK